MQAIILAGGFGTRLQSVVKEVPKPMAPINDKPFLAYLLTHLKQQGFEEIILSVHYLYDKIQNYFKDEYQGLSLQYAIEEQPLGTGGAILNALSFVDNDMPCFVLNGDTFIKLNYANMLMNHRMSEARMSMALRSVPDCSRYGQVILDENVNITEFRERGNQESGWINAGLYLLDKKIFSGFKLPDCFSFEKDFLFKHLQKIQPKGFLADDYFIDIGVPEDYERAVIEFKDFK